MSAIVSEWMAFATNLKQMSFVAAVRFQRTESRLVRLPGYEQRKLDEMPDITWWWYELLLEPQKSLVGQWPADRKVRLKTRSFIGSSSQRDWIGLIGKTADGDEQWLNAWQLVDDVLYRAMNSPFRVDELKNIDSAVSTWCEQNGVKR